MVAQARIRLVCSECKWKVTGSRGDSARRGCDRCGGQLREIRQPYGRRRGGNRGSR